MKAYEKLYQRILNNERILIDGATGSEVERSGFKRTDGASLSKVCLSNPNLLQKIHEGYIDSGAEIIITNTFGSAKHSLEDADISDHFEEINRKSAEIAICARNNHPNRDVLVAGGISYWSWMNNHPNTHILKQNIEEQSLILKNAGVDLIVLEMMIDIDRMIATLEGSLQSKIPVWVGLSCKVNELGKPCLLNGESIKDAVIEIKKRDVPLINIMHTEVEYVNSCLNAINNLWQKPIGVYAHSQKNKSQYWHEDSSISPKEYAKYCKGWLEKGVNLLGGCCGLHKPHILELRKLLSNYN